MRGDDIELYKVIFSDIKLTEKYLGFVPFDWFYSVVKYKAECTIGEDFDLFDKTIVGILMVEERLSLEEIGDILGLNVINDPENQRYRDEAEYEILVFALEGLRNYGMLETSDIYYSECRLTEIGREYAEKGRKFRVESDKEFLLFYDHTGGDHSNAKNMFSGLRGSAGKLDDDFNFLDESLMKELALVQASEIYDPLRGNSFRNPVVCNPDTLTRKFQLHVAVLADLESGQLRILAYDPITKVIRQEMSQWIMANKKDKIISDFYSKNEPVPGYSDLPGSYISELAAAQREIDGVINQDPHGAMTIARRVLEETGFVDWPYFWVYFDHFLDRNCKEIWCILKEYDDQMLDIIEKVSDNPDVPLFLVFAGTENLSLLHRVADLEKRSKNPSSLLFVMAIEEFDQFEFFSIGESDKKYSLQHFTIQLERSKYILPVLKVSTASQPTGHFKDLYLDTYLDDIEESVEERYGKLEKENLTKQLIQHYGSTDQKLKYLTYTGQSSVSGARIREIMNLKQEYLTKLKAKYQSKLSLELEKLITRFTSQEFSQLEPFHQYKEQLSMIENELFDEYDVLRNSINEFKLEIEKEENRVKDEKLAKFYVIDTNVFMEEPEIISRIEKKHFVVLSHTVINELDGLKRGTFKDKASKAIQVLNRALGNNKQLRTAKANTQSLPEDYQQNMPDNRILAVAYSYREKNVLLLTSDNGLQLKAKSLNIPTISLKDLLSPKESTSVSPEKVWSLCLEVFKAMPRQKFGKQNVGEFMKALKKADPEFELKKLGYENPIQFLRKVPHFSMIDNDFFRLKIK